MAREKKPPREARIEVRVRTADKEIFESHLAFNESLSNWLYVAGLERAARMSEAALARSAEPPPPPEPPREPPPPRKPAKAKPRRKR
jgi:hypothetical protein